VSGGAERLRRLAESEGIATGKGAAYGECTLLEGTSGTIDCDVETELDGGKVLSDRLGRTPSVRKGLFVGRLGGADVEEVSAAGWLDGARARLVFKESLRSRVWAASTYLELKEEARLWIGELKCDIAPVVETMSELASTEL
jgi:hypothetical protein